LRSSSKTTFRQDGFDADENPSYPGQSVCPLCREPLTMTFAEDARMLGVTRQALNNRVNASAASRR